MKKRLLKLFDGNGFLLFLFICVCVIAAGTILISTRGMEKIKDNSGNKELVILDDPIDDNTVLNENLVETAEEIAAEVEEIEEVLETSNVSELDFEDPEKELDDEVELVVDKPIQSKYVLPVNGDIITDYSFDSLIYSQTLEEWRGHCGIDIAGDLGTTVVAFKDGTVKEVYEDDLWGITIVIDHGEGLQSKYANLGTKEMVRVGLAVNTGDHISTIGNSAKIEMMMDPHLHFEVIKNGKIVDPRSITK